MHQSKEPAKAIRVHLTNLTGLGAVQLAQSLLPALEACAGFRIEEIYLPEKGALADYRRITPGIAPIRYRRYLPNALSRVLECTVFGRKFDGPVPLLVLGDVPMWCETMQTVFVQNPHLAARSSASWHGSSVKVLIARLLFRLNVRRASRLIVQTEAMKVAVQLACPKTRDAVHVVSQPVPQWLLNANLRRRGRLQQSSDRLKLIYPSAHYPHKNHSLLSSIGVVDADMWPVDELILTIPQIRNPNPELAWLRCVGLLSPAQILKIYESSDALLFLSTAESYGFPLVEAMWIGLPIICPDLPYARTLCGDGALYFEAGNLSSLRASVIELRNRLQSGWWPDWTARLQQLPDDWETVARHILQITSSPD